MHADKKPATVLIANGPAQSESTPDGRYIPYSGGSAGWYENSGVLKSERHNNYGYHVEMDLPQVRGRQFLRWATESEQPEMGERPRREYPLNLVLDGRSVAMTCRDLNEHGVRLQVTDDLELAVGSAVAIEMLDALGGAPLLVLDAQVISLETAGTMRQVWSIGLFFPNVSAEASAALKQLVQ